MLPAQLVLRELRQPVRRTAAGSADKMTMDGHFRDYAQGCALEPAEGSTAEAVDRSEVHGTSEWEHGPFFSCREWSRGALTSLFRFAPATPGIRYIGSSDLPAAARSLRPSSQMRRASHRGGPAARLPPRWGIPPGTRAAPSP